MKFLVLAILSTSLFMIGCGSDDDEEEELASGSPLILNSEGLASEYAWFSAPIDSIYSPSRRDELNEGSLKVNLANGSVEFTIDSKKFSCVASNENIRTLNQFFAQASITLREESEVTDTESTTEFGYFETANFFPIGSQTYWQVSHLEFGVLNPSGVYYFKSNDDYNNFVLVLDSYITHPCLPY